MTELRRTNSDLNPRRLLSAKSKNSIQLAPLTPEKEVSRSGTTSPEKLSPEKTLRPWPSARACAVKLPEVVPVRPYLFGGDSRPYTEFLRKTGGGDLLAS